MRKTAIKPKNDMGADIEKARGIAEALLEKYGIAEPVVDVFRIVKDEGLDLKFVKMPQEMEKVAGFFDVAHNTIFVNADDPTNRQVFTIAHELGHFKLEHPTADLNVLYRWSELNGNTPTEQEANAFAANLLVPYKMLKEVMKKYSLTKNDAAILAILFGVSKEVMGYRIKKIPE